MELSTKKHLKALLKRYKEKKLEFEIRHKLLINQFKLKENETKQVFYGMLFPDNPSLKKFTDILNSDLQLNILNDAIKEILLTGNLLIIEIIIYKDIRISGYDLKAFIESPNENYIEIDNLINGLGGYKHIHTIGGKVVLEIPARDYLKGHPNIIKIVDYWIKKLDVFCDN